MPRYAFMALVRLAQTTRRIFANYRLLNAPWLADLDVRWPAFVIRSRTPLVLRSSNTVCMPASHKTGARFTTSHRICRRFSTLHRQREGETVPLKANFDY
jgi:hypothetical protein